MINLWTNTITNKVLFIKAENDWGVAITKEVHIRVCLDEFTLVESQRPSFLYEKDSGIQRPVKYEELFSVSADQCDITSYTFFAFDGTPLALPQVTIDTVSKEIVIDSSAPLNTTIYVVAKNNFETIKRQDIRIQVCGNESVLLRDTGMISIDFLFATKTGIVAKESLAYSTWRSYFVTSDLNCPIIGHRLVSFD